MSDASLSFVSHEAGKYLLGIAFAVIVALLFRVAKLADRRTLLKFFGLTGKSGDIAIYLSRMKVLRTEGLELIQQGYQGAAILNPEMLGAVALRDLLKSVPVPILTRSIRDWMGRRFVTFAVVDPEIKVSPDPEKLRDLPPTTISLGSQVYNAISRKYLVDNPAHFEFKKAPDGERSIHIKSGGQKGLLLIRDEPGKEIGVLQRVNDSEHQRTYFICAGLGAGATLGCTLYLTDHWRELYEENGFNEFALYLVFRNQPSNADISVEPEAPVYVKRGKVPHRTVVNVGDRPGGLTSRH
jgi:hypothetical protein